MKRLEKVAALFVERGGVYWNLPGVDAWDYERDARRYKGPWPVVAHPPCQSWCMLAKLNEARWGKAIGDDSGCFESALLSVRRWGGVLEHPAPSLAFDAFGLSKPTSRGWQKCLDGSWVAEVAQVAYGHRARKLTWLLYCGDVAPLPLKLGSPKAQCVVTTSKRFKATKLPRLPDREHSRTPLTFRDFLLELARSCVGGAAIGAERAVTWTMTCSRCHGWLDKDGAFRGPESGQRFDTLLYGRLELCDECAAGWLYAAAFSFLLRSCGPFPMPVYPILAHHFEAAP
ncbi:MAG TPA: hypothetical protein VMB05_18420 [Solirubrobacteraceae bacterium]|nr:hypothetical protein [Solirubrobacteraceae bacterium]